jgi:hypothetical protein
MTEVAKYNVPEEMLVVPIGEHEHHSGTTQVCDRKALKNLKTQFDKDGSDLLVDYDHFSEDPDKPSEAAGWITAMEVRPDGLWAKVRWTKGGIDAVGSGRYRNLSPVFLAGEGDRVRPRKLKSVALTNNAALKGLILNRAVSRMGLGVDEQVDYRLELLTLLGLDSGASDAELNHKLHLPNTDIDEGKLLRKLLRLSPSADDADIKQALDDRQHRARTKQNMGNRHDYGTQGGRDATNRPESYLKTDDDYKGDKGMGMRWQIPWVGGNPKFSQGETPHQKQFFDFVANNICSRYSPKDAWMIAMGHRRGGSIQTRILRKLNIKNSDVFGTFGTAVPDYSGYPGKTTGYLEQFPNRKHKRRR